jgi:hypothetical protein
MIDEKEESDESPKVSDNGELTEEERQRQFEIAKSALTRSS